MNIKLYVRFVGYNKNSKIPTLSLNIQNNKYCCSRCGIGGYSTGLYAKVKGIDTKKAYKELIDRECFSMDRSNITISPINIIADIDKRDIVYRAFLNMLKLNNKHRRYLEDKGLLKSSIENEMYRSIPNKYIHRRLIANSLKREFDLSGIPGFFQEEDWGWNFTGVKGFFIPIFNENNKIEALSIRLDTPFNDTQDIWFSSKDKINGTGTKNLVCKSNIDKDTKTVILTDDLILYTLIKDCINAPVIAFSSITNSYQILNELDNTNIKNIIFTVRCQNQKLDYIINRVFRDLLPLGYSLDNKVINSYKDILKEDFIMPYYLKESA